MSDIKYIKLTACTWQKDSYNLFDNHSSNLNKASFSIYSSSTVYLENNKCKLYTPRSQKFMLPSFEPLLGFKLSQNDYVAYQLGSSFNKRPWISIRYSYPKGIEIAEGDVIRLGRIRLKVRRIIIKTEELKTENMPRCFDSLASLVDVNEVIENEASCRICFCNDSNEENPLVAPCECIGSIKYIHVECLKSWLKTRVQTKATTSAVSYYWKDLLCELCKSSLPASIYYNNHKLDLVSIDYPKNPYILFEEFVADSSSSNGIHIVSINTKNSLYIGRAQETDLRITDISVSRYHSNIRFEENKFVLYDNKSKFGTLLKMQKVMSLVKGKKIAIQVGRTLLHMCVKKKINWKKCCSKICQNSVSDLSYITQEAFDQAPNSAIDISPSIHHGQSFSYNEDGLLL